MKGDASAPPPFFSDAVMGEAVTIIRQGGVVAIPTETYYGLAVDPFNEDAVARLFTLKKRPSAKPLLTLVACRSHLAMLTPEIPPVYIRLMDFWPGPLTLVFKAHPALSPRVTGKTGTVGARISSHPLANFLVSRVDQPVTATSANIAGQPAAVTATEVYRAFGPRIDYVVDGGRTPGGKGSTLVGLAAGRLVLIREGVIDFAKIKVAELEVGGEKTGS
ncbi:MAG: threonylcarbamoyl-AMP synthase [Deltaproteobacteria bacterium]|nr:threonylcarbamoyl-AMP synthase [Deltaproteobacteria bacterium]